MWSIVIYALLLIIIMCAGSYFISSMIRNFQRKRYFLMGMDFMTAVCMVLMLIRMYLL